VEEALIVDPALADRRARELADRSVSIYCPGHALVELFARAGDPARTIAWAEALAAEDPTDAEAHLALAIALARARNAPRARLSLEAAEFWASVRGVGSRRLAEVFLEEEQPIEALAASRLALALAVGADRQRAFEILIEAALAAGRSEDAREVLRAYLSELPLDHHAAARARLYHRLGDRSPSWLIVDAPTAAVGELAEPVAPWSVEAREAEARAERPGATARVALEASLLLQGIASDGPLARMALEAFARLAAADGRHDLAREARLEARRLPDGP